MLGDFEASKRIGFSQRGKVRTMHQSASDDDATTRRPPSKEVLASAETPGSLDTA